VPMVPDRSGARDKLLETIYILTEIHSGHPRYPPENHFEPVKGIHPDPFLPT
jgi:hypothetical protein